MKKRRGKPAGMNYADVLARKRMIRQAVQDEVILHEVNGQLELRDLDENTLFDIVEGGAADGEDDG